MCFFLKLKCYLLLMMVIIYFCFLFIEGEGGEGGRERKGDRERGDLINVVDIDMVDFRDRE